MNSHNEDLIIEKRVRHGTESLLRQGAKCIDVSHTIEDGLVTYKGLPAPIICDYLSRAESRRHYTAGTEFHIGQIEMVANTGTYLDSPFHRYPDGKDIAELSLSRLANLEGLLIRMTDRSGRAITPAARPGVKNEHKEKHGFALCKYCGIKRHHPRYNSCFDCKDKKS